MKVLPALSTSISKVVFPLEQAVDLKGNEYVIFAKNMANMNDSNLEKLPEGERDTMRQLLQKMEELHINSITISEHYIRFIFEVDLNTSQSLTDAVSRLINYGEAGQESLSA